MHADRPSLLKALRFGDTAERLFVLGPFLALGLVLVLLWTLVGWFVWRFPEDLIADEQRELQASATILSRETEAVLRDAENALRSLDLLLLTRGEDTATDDASLALLTDSLRDGSRGLIDLMLGTPSGSLYRIPSRSRSPFANVGAHAFVSELHKPGASRLIVGAPLQLRPQGRSVIPVAMRLSAPQGEFSMALALVDPEILNHQQQLRLRSPTEAFSLLRDDGLGLLRTPYSDSFVGRQLFDEHPQRRQLFAGRSGHFVEDVGPVDGLRRIVAFQSLQHFPLKLVASQSLDQVLGGHLRQRRAVLLFSAIISVAAMGITLWLARIQRRQRLLDAERSATADASPLGLFRCDLSGRVVYANKTYLQMHGLSAEQQAWGWLQLIEPDKRDEAKRQWREWISSGQPIRVVRRLHLPDGTARLVSVLTNPVRVNGRVVAQAGTIEDISARATEQKAMRTLSSIFELTPDYVAQIDLEGHLLYLNPAARQRLGLGREASLGELRFQHFVGLEGEQRFRDIVMPAAERDGHWQGRAELIDAQGQRVPVECTALLHRTPRGRIEAISAIMRDITAELQAQRELRRNAAVLGAIAHTSQAMISVLDLDQQLLFCNKAFEERFGVADRSWRGLHVSEVLGSKAYERNRPLIERGLRGEEAEIDQRVGDRDAPHFLRLHYAPLRSEDQGIEGLIFLVTDVTDQKREELRLRKASQSDPLTQLLNRAGFMDQAQECLHDAAAKGVSVALLYLDLDRFKPVNDQHGHPIGDALLQAVARRLQHALRPQDVIARLGGDEFTVLLPVLEHAGDAQIVADKLVHAMSQPFRIETLELHIGASVGYCCAEARGLDLNALIQQADAQLYEAKRQGRGRARGIDLRDEGLSAAPAA